MSNHDFSRDINRQDMGLMTSYRWIHEPRGVLFMLARYKFVAQMLDGYGSVLEIGCGDGFGARLVRPSVGELTCIDIDRQMLGSANTCQRKYGINFAFGDGPDKKYDAIYALDVMEHIEHRESLVWLKKLAIYAPLVIIGMPTLEMQAHASKLSKENHVNCMTMPDLKSAMKRHFRHVLMFSQNDEMIGTGFHKLSAYAFALGINA